MLISLVWTAKFHWFGRKFNTLEKTGNTKIYRKQSLQNINLYSSTWKNYQNQWVKSYPSLWPIFSDAFGSHNYFQRPQRRLVRFSWVFSTFMTQKSHQTTTRPRKLPTMEIGPTTTSREASLNVDVYASKRLRVWASSLSLIQTHTYLSSNLLSRCVCLQAVQGEATPNWPPELSQQAVPHGFCQHAPFHRQGHQVSWGEWGKPSALGR